MDSVGSGRHPRLLAISDRRQLGPAGIEGWLAALAEGPVDGVQIREKDLGDREILALARMAREALPAEKLVLVNRRADIAVAAGADGVHLTSKGLPVAALRRRFGQGLVIGDTTHSVEEVLAAGRDGADYVTFGPVWPTPSKERYGPPPGLTGLRRAAAVGPPVLALGGVTIPRAREAAAVGAAGIAGIRLFLSPDDPELASAAAPFSIP